MDSHAEHGSVNPGWTPRRIAEDEENGRAEIRRQVRRDAERDRAFRLHPDIIKKAFENHPDEWAELAELRRAARERAARIDEERQASAHLAAETKRVLKEWDEERRLKAEVEARQRLGLPPAGASAAA